MNSVDPYWTSRRRKSATKMLARMGLGGCVPTLQWCLVAARFSGEFP